VKGVRVEYHTVARGTWLLLRAGVAVAPWRAGTVYDPRYPIEALDDGAVRLRLVVLDTDGTTGRDYAGAAVCEIPVDEPGTAVVPLDAGDLAAVREAALAAIVLPTTVRLGDGVLYDLSERAQTNWASLWNAHRLAVEVGSSAFATTFYAADGTEVELDTYEEARGLYLTLFAAGDALRRAHLARVAAIEDAATVADVVAVLEGR
jgi:hypothetical protein